jgi:hypothetical protein
LTLNHSTKLLHKIKRSVFAALSARVGSIGDNKLGARIPIARTNPRSIKSFALHQLSLPEHLKTWFSQRFTLEPSPRNLQKLPKHQNAIPHQAAIHILNTLENLTPEDSGHFLDCAGKQIP